MAWAFTYLGEYHIGGTRVAYGTYSNVSSGTGGVIKTGLSVVETISLTPSAADSPYYTTTLPSTAADGAVTIVTGSTIGGSWEVKGV
jgi:hypothetical protein